MKSFEIDGNRLKSFGIDGKSIEIEVAVPKSVEIGDAVSKSVRPTRETVIFPFFFGEYFEHFFSVLILKIGRFR